MANHKAGRDGEDRAARQLFVGWKIDGKSKKDNRGITFIEIMLVSAILLIIGSWVVRIFYAHEIHEWEDGIYRSIGIDPEWTQFPRH